MTREEAIELVARKLGSGRSRSVIANDIDKMVALGLLKLDEPKSKRERFAEELERTRLVYTNKVTVAEALAAFDAVEGE